MRQLTFKMPNELIGDTQLSYSARRVAAALYAHKNALGCTHKSYEQLAQLTGLSTALCACCSVRQMCRCAPR